MSEQQEIVVGAVAVGDRQRHDYLTDHTPYAQLYLPRVRDNDEHLTRLEYPNRFFNDEHAKRLAEALKTNTRLTCLSFPNNQMTDEGLLHLLAPLEKNSSITELNLENNSIGDRATRSLLFTLRRHNHTITNVNLTSNRVSAELLKDLQFSCHLNQQPEMWKRAIVVLADNSSEGPNAIELDLDSTQTAPEGAHVAGVAAVGAGNTTAASSASIVGMNSNNLNITGNPFHDQLASVNKAATAATANASTMGSPLSQGGQTGKGVGWKGSLTEGSVLRADNQPNASDVLARTGMVSVQLLSDTLKANTTITRLDLRGNLLGDARAGLIVDALLQNTTLREINLNTNRLTCESAIAFAEVLRTNNTLTELGLANNSIADMGATAFIECLRVNNTIGLIDLHLNTIAPEKINQLLNSLMLNSQPKDLKQLLPDIQLNSSRVDKLNFSTYTADAAQRINDISARVLYNALRQNTTVTHVDLSNNRLTDNGAQQLAYMLEHNYTIQTLLLNNNNIGNNGAAALVEALKANAAITRLELDKNPINDFWKRQLAIAVKLNSEPLVFKKVAPALLANDTGVQVVDFSCLTGTLCSVNTCHLLCDVLQHNTSLRELSLARNAPVGVEGVSVVCSMLAANKCSGLRDLDVSGIGLHDGANAILANMLKTNTSLKVLKIGGNPITTAVDFIQVLGEFNHTLIQLDCAGTRLSEGDLRDLSLLTRLNTQPLRFKHIIIDLFANNPTLTDLNLCEYEKSGLTQYRYLKCYDDQSMELLCDALISNTHLRSLNVSNNRITDVGACALATVLQHNSTLTTLNLSNNDITDNGGVRIARALLQNGSVTLVSIDKNKISPETRQRINQAAQTNALREGSLDKRLSAPRASSGQHQLVSSMLGATRAPTEAELLKLEEDSILQDALRDQELLASVARSGAMRQLLVE